MHQLSRWTRAHTLLVRRQVCCGMLVLVFSLAILPDLGIGGDWHAVDCRVIEAQRSDSPSPVRAAPPGLCL